MPNVSNQATGWKVVPEALCRQARTASWVIREKSSGAVMFETFNAAVPDALNTAKYEAVPILEYLQEIARQARSVDLGPSIRSSTNDPTSLSYPGATLTS